MTTPEPAAPEALLPEDHERRLHPGSWLFVLLQNLRQFIVPLLVLLFAGGRRDDGYPWWLPLIGVGALVVVSVWMARHENVQVTYETQRRPRLKIRTVPAPAPDPVSDPVPEAAR